MIRRDARAADGAGVWLLIDQVAHARLAGQLAAMWRWPPAFGREQFLAAIFHHDDGWAAWDAAPGVDPKGHRPLAFTEMPMAVSTALWTGSIATAEAIGPLAAFMVAGHFHALAERHDSWRRGPDEERLAAERFNESAAARMATARARWAALAASSAGGAALDADKSLAWLQLFDAVSLWFCCAPRTSGESFLLPEREPADSPAPDRAAAESPLRRRAAESNGASPRVAFTPLDEDRTAVEPWPFAASEAWLEATARVVPACAITTPRLNLPADCPTRRLVWRLERRA